MMLFSVVIPLYNKANHISATLNSVIKQSFTDFEIIIVNDGSTDDSLDIVNSFSDERIQIYSTENKGVSYARNFGIKKAKTDYIVFIDADDIWKPYHLEDLKQLQEQFPNCGMYAKAYEIKTKNRKIRANYKNISSKKDWKGKLDDFFISSLSNCIASSSSVMIPKTVFDSVGYFNINYNSGEDIDLWIRIALVYSIAFYNKVSSTINWDGENRISNSLIHQKKHFKIEAFNEEEKNNISLKKYLDLNRLSLAFQNKLENRPTIAKNYIKQIDKKNIKPLQKLLFNFPTIVLRLLIYVREQLRKLNIDLRLFK